MSKDELDPQRLQSEINNWKTQFDMLQGKANGILSTAGITLLQNCADKMMMMIGEIQKLRAQVVELEKLVPKPKEAPKTEMPPKKK